MNRLMVVSILGLVGLIGTARPTTASPILLEFKGTVSSITTDDVGLSAVYGIDLGTEVFGTISWDTDAFAAFDPTASFYPDAFSDPQFIAMSLTAGTSSAQWRADYVALSGNGLAVMADGGIQTSSNPYPDFIDFKLDASTPPPSLYDLMQSFDPAVWTHGQLRVGQEAGSGQFNYYADISEVKAVPEPATWMVLAISALGFMLRKNRTAGGA